MATPEPQQRNTTDVDHVMPDPDQHLSSDGITLSPGHQLAQPVNKASDPILQEEQRHNVAPDGLHGQFVRHAQNSAPEHRRDQTDLEHQSKAVPLESSDAEVSFAQHPPSAECSSPLPEHSAMSSPGLARSNMSGIDLAPSGFMFPRVDRRNIGLGSKLWEGHPLVPHGSDLTTNVPSSQGKETQSSMRSPVGSSSPVMTAMNGITSHSTSRQTVPSGSDSISAASHTSSQSIDHDSRAQKDHVRHQVGEQNMQEASMSDEFEHELRSEAQSDDVVCVGVNAIMPNTNGRTKGPRETMHAQPSQPALRSMVPSKQSVLVRDTMAKRLFPHFYQPAPDRSFNPITTRQHPRVHASPDRPRARGTAPVSLPDETQDLLDVVAYKFREKEQSLQRAFSADQRKMRSELQQAFDENETLKSQLAAFEEECSQSEAAISKYKSQIGKAKGLQKFLDGLGNDLFSLKRSYEIEKSCFAIRIEASEAEIERLESSLAGKDEFETMLSHSKITLEKLLDAKHFELQSVIQHRDMLRSQLDERIGQLVEERDSRMRLEQLVAQLRLDGSVSLTAALEKVTTPLLSKMSGLGQQGDELATDVSGILQNVQTLKERRSATLDDCKAFMAEMHELGLRITQGLSIEAATNTTVVDLTTSVEGLIQHHMRTLRQELERMVASWKESATSEEAHAALQVQLHGANGRLTQLECQLNATTESEVSANNALNESLARISELEAVTLRSPMPSGESTAQLDVELKVQEAIAVAQKHLSDNANAFIAQEKARYGNELKKIKSEHRKATEKADTQAEELSQLHSELSKLRNTGKYNASETVRQLEDLRGRFDILGRKYEAAQLEADGKAILESKLATAITELNTANLKITAYEKKAVNLSQEIKESKAALLQARASEEQLRSRLEEIQRKSDACTDDLHRQLSQMEGKVRYAEAGLDQMRSSAERTIAEEQEKHRKQREALQKRLDEAQTELQMKSTETDETNAFVERTVKYQQEAWEKSYADLESKVSAHKLSLELASKRLSDVQTERDSTQTQLAHLEAELQQKQDIDSRRQAREATNQSIIEGLRTQHDTAQKKITSLQDTKNQHDRLDEERETREKASKQLINELREERDSAQFLIGVLQDNEMQRASDEIAREAREKDFQSKMSGLRNECDEATASLRALRAANDRQQNQDQATVKPGHEPMTENIMPPRISESQAPLKQRRKVDRNNNTIVTENVRNAPQPIDFRGMRTQTQVSTPTLPTLTGEVGHRTATRPSLRNEKASDDHQQDRLPSSSGSLENDEMLDSTITPAVVVKAPAARTFGSTLQTNSTQDEAGLPKTASRALQTFSIPLDFSGNPRVGRDRSPANNAPSTIPLQGVQSPNFQIYEDSQILVSDSHFEVESVGENFTFRKPFPRSNSASKRVTRMTSDKSIEGRDVLSRSTQRAPDNTGYSTFSPSNNTPEKSNYPFGSSPEFMNTPSLKVKRQYSGPNRPGSAGQSSARPPSSPMADPRLTARSGAAKRGSLQDSQQTEDPPAKKRAVPAATKAAKKQQTNESLSARSSQSVKDLPRVEDMNAGRSTGKSQSSHMRSSATSTRTTRNQAKASKDDAYKARFRQELKDP